MDTHMIQVLQGAVGVFGGVMIMAALALLWSKSRSGWLLLGLAGAAASMLFRLVLMVVPTLFTSNAATFPLIWSATFLLEAVGLLGYALEESNRRS